MKLAQWKRLLTKLKAAFMVKICDFYGLFFILHLNIIFCFTFPWVMSSATINLPVTVSYFKTGKRPPWISFVIQGSIVFLLSLLFSFITIDYILNFVTRHFLIHADNVIVLHLGGTWLISIFCYAGYNYLHKPLILKWCNYL